MNLNIETINVACYESALMGSIDAAYQKIIFKKSCCSACWCTGYTMHALYVVEFCLPNACLWDDHMMMHHDV